MATSGTIEGNTLSGEGSYIDWQLAGQDTGGNASLINWQSGWRFPAFTCRGLRLGSASVNGTTVWNNTASGDGVHSFNGSHNHTPKLQLASGQIWVAHNADGTKSFSLSVSIRGWEGGGPNFLSSGSGSFDLPTIPRFSSPPSTPVITDIDQTSFFVTFTDGTGGAPIDGREIRYGTDPSGVGATIEASDGSSLVIGLSQGTTYYVWARTHNSAGYSDWSPRAQATTWDIPAIMGMPGFDNVQQTSLDVTWTPPSDGGTPILSYDIAYNTVNSISGATIVSDLASPRTVTGLSPGIKYWFFVRAVNLVGEGLWSDSRGVTMIAGARIKDGGVYKLAVPYVKDAGEWKLARPWVKNLGVWKETI